MGRTSRTLVLCISVLLLAESWLLTLVPEACVTFSPEGHFSVCEHVSRSHPHTPLLVSMSDTLVSAHLTQTSEHRMGLAQVRPVIAAE